VRRKYIPYLFLAPSLVILLMVVIYPLIYSLRLSFTNFNFGRPIVRFVGVQNYRDLLRDPDFWESLRITMTFTGIGVSIEFIFGLTSALILSRKFRCRGIVRTLCLLPMMITPVVVGMIWLVMYQPDFSVINYFLHLIRSPVPLWLQKSPWPLVAVIITDIWEWTPFFTLVLLSGLGSLPIEPYEAAVVDGASKWQLLRYITLPLLIPLILVVLLIRIMDAFKVYDIIYVMTEGGPGMSTMALSLFIYKAGFTYRYLGYASAISYVMIIVLIILSMILIKGLQQLTR